MRYKVAIFFVVLIFLIGVGIMSYPLVSSIMNNMNDRSSMAGYISDAKDMNEDRLNTFFSQAEEYNDSLTGNVIITDPFDQEAYEKIGAGYQDAFDVDGTGLIGYVKIPKINVYLPINHGTSEDILKKGAGHLQNTSLPIGGESTHSVISAHTGYPTDTFFDNLVDLKKGDEFYIYVLNKTLKYEVDQIKIILPSETDDLRIITGEDHITLLTCTPYGINDHRLLVRGIRKEYTEENSDENQITAISVDNNYLYFFGYKMSYFAVAGSIIGFIFFVAIIVFISVKKISKGKAKHLAMYSPKRKKEKNEV